MAEPLTREQSDVGLTLGLGIGNLRIGASSMVIHIQASILRPYVQAEVTIFEYAGRLGWLNNLVIGMDAALYFSGGENVSEDYVLPMVLIDVENPRSSSLQGISGEITLRLVSRWVYHARAFPVKTYVDMESVDSMLQEEFRDIGYATDTFNVYQPPEDLDSPLSFYRTDGPYNFIMQRVLPWCEMGDDAAPFWYMNLKGEMEFQTGVNMRAQPVTAFLAPSYVFYEYDEDLPGYAFTRRSYKTNPKRTMLYDIRGSYFAQGEPEEFDEHNPVDLEGKAMQIEREGNDGRGRDVMDIWYVGHRPLQQIRGHARFMRRNHIFHQIHVLTFDDLHAASHCDVGTHVRMYDFGLYIPREEEDAAPREELIPSNMMGDYVVAASHYYYDGLNEQGMIGSKLELVKVGHDETALEGIEHLSDYKDI